MSFTVGSLFAGYGGIELALHEVLGAEPAWFSEIEKAPSRILAHHWPGVPNHGDITRIRWSDVEPVDIITGGSPCQDLSHAGKRAGMKAGTRSGLWASMCDAIETIRPSLVVWENVRGALTAEGEPPTPEILDAEAAAARTERALVTVRRRLERAERKGQAAHVQYHRRDSVRLSRRYDREVGAVRRARRGLVRALGRVVGDLAALGYDAAWTGLRAADVGAPHGRWRVFVVAWPQSDPGALSWPQSDPGALLPTPAVNDMGRAYTPDEWDQWTERMRAQHGNGNGHGRSLHVEALRLLPSPTTSDTNGAGEHGDGGLDLRTAVSLLPTPRATRGGSGTETMYALGGERSDDELPQGQILMPTPSAADATGGHLDRFGQYSPAIARWEAALGRPAPAPTEPTGRDGAPRLSPRFVEWMMGLPDGWVTDVPGVSRNDALKALGNGVVPQQAAAAVRHLLGVREAHATKAVAA